MKRIVIVLCGLATALTSCSGSHSSGSQTYLQWNGVDAGPRADASRLCAMVAIRTHECRRTEPH
jgi:hypothetical protein